MNQKTSSEISFERVARAIQQRFNPIRGLTPQNLSNQLDQFQVGNLRQFALTMDAIERRDDVIKSVAPKRKKSVSRLKWEILAIDDSPEAQRHKEALEFFYNNLTATDALNQNKRGSVKLLVKQMMDAVGKSFAVHEIVWKPGSEGLTAEFRFVPLWFFENKTGKLRFLKQEFDLYGMDLEEAGWMVTCEDGIMEACAVAYMFKHLPLQDWMIYCEKHGMPGIHGKTDAALNSPEWNQMIEAVAAIAADFSCVTSKSAEIEKIDFSQNGELPFPKLVERMDRALASLWRGADLSTISAGTGQGQGASLQGDEADILKEDDADLISETLNMQVDNFVIRYVIGDVKPLAYFKIIVPQKKNVDADVKVDTFLVDRGFPMSHKDAAERYGRPLPEDGETLLVKPAAPTIPQNNFPNEAASDGLIENALAAAMDIRPMWLAPLKPFFAELEAKMQDQGMSDADLIKFLEQASNKLPEIFGKMKVEELSKVLEAGMGTAVIQGIQEHLNQTGQKP